MKKKFLALVLTLAMVLSLVPATALATEGVTEETQADTQVEQENEGTPSTNPDASETVTVPEAGKAAIGETIYPTVKEAVEAAKSGDTIILGEGNYTLYKIDSATTTKGKNLTFIGQGTKKTGWNIGALVPDPANFGTEYNGDYSFDGAGTVTFQNMTLRSGTADYLGFIRADKTIVKDCTINGKTFYWGYTSAEFINTTFNCPEGDYALWTYSSPVMTFDDCKFNSSGKVINVYTDAGAGKNDITVNFEDCTIDNKIPIKQVLNINDSNMGNFKYNLNISGDIKVSGVEYDKVTCSRLFGFGGKADKYNKGNTIVKFGNTVVWQDGKMVNEKAYHNKGVTVENVSYNNGVTGANDSLYAEGYKDNAFTTTYGSWRWDQSKNKLARTVTKTCQYCGTGVKSTEYKDLELDVSRSKTATELDSNRKSTVKLSLPSAEENLVSDVVFVMDDSECSGASGAAAKELVSQLLAQQELTNAQLKVGMVVFGGTAIVARELSEVKNANELDEAINNATIEGLHGSNIQSGLIEADKMLSKDTTVANNRKYVVLISDGHTYQFSKEGDYCDDYTVGTDSTNKFSGLTTYGIYSETDLYAYAYGITYTIHNLHDEYYTDDYTAEGYKGDWKGKYLTDQQYIFINPKNNAEYVRNEYEMPYGTWNKYLKHITEVVTSDNGKYDKALAYDSTGNYGNQCIGIGASTPRTDRIEAADQILGKENYIKCGLDEKGNDNQLMHASGVDRSVYEAYMKYASMAKKYNCYPIYVKNGAAVTTQDYGYQLMNALGEISNNTGTDVGTPNALITAPNITNIFKSIKNDILYAVGAGSVVEDKMGANFDFVLGSLKLTVDGEALDSKVDGDNSNITYFGAKNTTEEIGSDNYRFKVECDSANDKFTWTINENVSNFAPVQLSYQVKLVNANTAAGTYKVLTNEYAKLTPKNSAGQFGKELTFNNPEVSYTVSGGSGGSHKPTVTIPDDVPTGLNGKDHYAYVVGYPDGMVYPQKNITRAEVATIFFRLLKDETREANMTKSNGYNDMKDGAWYTCAVSTLSKMGIIKGYEDGSFKPDASISRAEFAAIAARFDPDGDKTPATFSDVSSHWAKDEISIAANHGWIKGYEDGSFKPDQKITRAETMTLVNRVLKRLPETKDDLHKDMKTWPDNQNESAWFYLAVQEATNSHYQNLKKDGTHEKWESMRETRDWAALEK